ncbi:hypothetical protein BXZ70DRAFT_1002635 [Cristinia sonorae]|uniref:TRIP4/RQT4 C2HC5-type zinc finger domain-containing protein n=1 Tax=Cristinia sonorae TaxID=1940300 RepID=A0A8K0UFL2_9AGAR|nr:hypothetical protein BXZ70DRAFT_1002635 [Cristinia sonorae]
MYHTAWTTKKKSSSSLPSDRIPPANKSSAQANTGKGKGKQKEVPKSAEVRRLEELRDGLKNSQGPARDPHGGCFCLARTHGLSPYTPICRQCGLILCSLNRPYFVCPHCTAQLLADPARNTLIASLEKEIEEKLEKEERDRQQAIQDAREAAGAFPSLSGAVNPLAAPPRQTTQTSLDSHPVNQTHKVLSLNSKTRKIKVESRRTVPAAAASRPPSRSGDAASVNQVADGVPARVPRPPSDVVVPTKPLSSDRPWARLDNYDVVYVPAPKAAAASGAGWGLGEGM